MFGNQNYLSTTFPQSALINLNVNYMLLNQVYLQYSYIESVMISPYKPNHPTHDYPQ